MSMTVYVHHPEVGSVEQLSEDDDTITVKFQESAGRVVLFVSPGELESIIAALQAFQASHLERV